MKLSITRSIYGKGWILWYGAEVVCVIPFTDEEVGKCLS